MAFVILDTRSGVFSVELAEGQVARTIDFDSAHLVDVDSSGQVLSIEVLDPANPRIEEIAASFGIEDRVPEILRAIEAAYARPDTAAAGEFRMVQGASSPNGGAAVESSSRGSVAREIDLVSCP
jgi:uncharacterized protein YuzE